MSYADPQSLTVNSVAKSLARIGSTNPSKIATFSTSEGDFSLSVHQNSSTTRFRREARFTQKKVAADPISAVNKEVSASIIFAVDEPKWGFSDVELGYLIAALNTWWTASSSAKATQLLGGEL